MIGSWQPSSGSSEPGRDEPGRDEQDRDEPGVTRLLADLVTQDADLTSAPPGHPQLRAAILTAARLRAADWPLPDPAELPPAAAPYLRQVCELSELIPTLLAHSAGSAQATVVDGWNATDVVAHLVAVDALAAESLGLPTPEETGIGSDVPTRTASVQRAFEGTSMAEALRVWRAQAAALARHTRAVGVAGMEREVSYLGIALSAGDVVLDRAFETWIHGDDLRVGLGLAPRDPVVGDVHRMSDLGARMLRHTWSLGDDGYAAAEVLLELTGPGGGTWRVGSDGAALLPGAALPEVAAAGVGGLGPREAGIGARVVLEAIEFCRLAGGRALPDRVPHTVQGDRRLGEHLLAATALLARP